jgi:hypothetical protein
MMYANVRRNIRVPCQEFLDSIKGILFMGTPHRGSQAASLGSICADMLKAASWGRNTNTTLIKVLKEGSAELQTLSNDFPFLGAGLAIYTFIESESMSWLKDPVRPDKMDEPRQL